MRGSLYYVCVGCLAYLATGSLPSKAQDPPIGILLAAGDIATCSSRSVTSGDETAKVVLREIDRAEKAGVQVRVIALGDLAYDHGSQESFKCFDKTWGKFKAKILPVPGNHDYETDGAASAYFRYFKPTLDPLRDVKDTDAQPGNYVLDFPSGHPKPWRLIALNSNMSTGADSAQVRWLDRQLQASKGKCILAFSHAYFYSSGFHGHKDAKDLAAPLVPLEVMRPLFTTLYKHRTSLFLAGHDHHYEQLGRAKPTPGDDGELGSPDGVRSFVVGTGGKDLYKTDYNNKWAFTEAYDLRSFGILKIELRSSSYSWEFLPTTPSSSMVVLKEMKSDVCNSE